MKLKERVWSHCKECNKTKEVIQEEIYGCDTCKKPIDEQYLELRVFGDASDKNSHNASSKRYKFCSWSCLFKKLKKIKSDDFAALPFLSYDATQKGIKVKDFWKAVRDFK